MRITKMFVLMFSMFSMISLFSCSTPLYEGSFPIDKNLSESQRKAAVTETVVKFGWSVEFPSTGVYRIKVQRRNHYATFDIICKEISCDVKYVDSNNLKYDESRKAIHYNYNRWVKKFVKHFGAKVRPTTFDDSVSTTTSTKPATSTEVKTEVKKEAK